MRKSVTTEELLAHIRTCFSYDPETGEFSRNGNPMNGPNMNKPAGKLCKYGYRHVVILGKEYMEHCIVWLYAHGELPNVVDHIDGNRANNRLANLRSVDDRINQQNQIRPRSNNKSGFLGVSKAGNKWKATIVKDRKSIYLGAFDSPEEAHSVYVAKKREIHEGCTI